MFQSPGQCPQCERADLVRKGGKDQCPVCFYLQPCCDGGDLCGPPEPPALLHGDGTVRDLSALLADVGPDTLSRAGLAALASTMGVSFLRSCSSTGVRRSTFIPGS